MRNIAYFDIPADKIDRAKHFYSALLGWKIEPQKTSPDQESIASMRYLNVLTGKPKKGIINMGGLDKQLMTETIKNHVEVGYSDTVLAKVETL